MGIGAAILLLAAGAILTFAMDLYAYGIDFDVVGAILMAAGVLGIVITLVIYAPRRRSGPEYEPRPLYDPRYDRSYGRSHDYDY